MVTVMGNYRVYVGEVEAGEFELDADKMAAAITDETTAAFFTGLQGTQMFEIWCRERCNLAKAGYPRNGMFESRIADEMQGMTSTAKASQDVTTARTLVGVSRNLRKTQAEDGDTVMQCIRQHGIWKQGSFWSEMLQESIVDAGLDFKPDDNFRLSGGSTDSLRNRCVW